ncbi:roadblock/LC7 domain-containing protein [Anaeromyxobacter sp. SG64]|uniref:roadblock/LC7 domain-containing protein n=1 Tax=Anaeromyxobacter sp. SG64 TaxID=2925409 RepID=UPI001F59CCAF|nr:roadblock/LC7 domain-containing protein [Anaeromyxobacter sp. SG64]
MDTILQSLLDLPGVNASLVFDADGHLLAHRGRTIYDRDLCQQVSGWLVKAVDAVQLQQGDWESMTAQFADGKLLLRSLGLSRDGKSHVLALVADAALNPSFATVAIRVATAKLKKALEGGGAASSSQTLGGSAAPPPAASSSVLPSDSKPVLANSGLSWSKVSSSGLSRIAVADPASAAFLSRCAKELARYVGPISKVYVEEGVHRVSPEHPFALAASRALVDDLAAQIEDAADRAAFREALDAGDRLRFRTLEKKP